MNHVDPTGSARGYALSLAVDESVDVEALLTLIANVDTDGVRIRDVRDADRSTVPVAVDELTEVQRDTLVRAVEAGYYSTPREVTLSEFVEEFDVSKSAISQRLRNAEMTIVRQVAEGLIRNGHGEVGGHDAAEDAERG